MKNHSQYFKLLVLVGSVSCFPHVRALMAQQPDAPSTTTATPAGEPHVAGQTVSSPPQVVPSLPVPRLIQFSGVMKDAAGQARTSPAGLTFSIYKDQEGGSTLWMETHNVELDAQGRYSVLLGSSHSEGVPLELFSTGEPRWLGVKLELPGEVEQPRVLLVSVPYALKAADAETLGGKPASAYALAAEAATAGNSGEAPPRTRDDDPERPRPLRGLGTPGFLAKFIQPHELGNSVLFEKNGFVGVGTSHPSQTLEVFGNLKISGNGNGIFFPDGTFQGSAAKSGGTVTQINTGPGLIGGPITMTGTLGLDLTFTDARYAQLGSPMTPVTQNLSGAINLQGNITLTPLNGVNPTLTITDADGSSFTVTDIAQFRTPNSSGGFSGGYIQAGPPIPSEPGGSLQLHALNSHSTQTGSGSSLDFFAGNSSSGQGASIGLFPGLGPAGPGTVDVWGDLQLRFAGFISFSDGSKLTTGAVPTLGTAASPVNNTFWGNQDFQGNVTLTNGGTITTDNLVTANLLGTNANFSGNLVTGNLIGTNANFSGNLTGNVISGNTIGATGTVNAGGVNSSGPLNVKSNAPGPGAVIDTGSNGHKVQLGNGTTNKAIEVLSNGETSMSVTGGGALFARSYGTLYTPGSSLQQPSSTLPPLDTFVAIDPASGFIVHAVQGGPTVGFLSATGVDVQTNTLTNASFQTQGTFNIADIAGQFVIVGPGGQPQAVDLAHLGKSIPIATVTESSTATTPGTAIFLTPAEQIALSQVVNGAGVSSITAGTGLTGGGTGNVTLAINPAVVATLGTGNTFTGSITAPLFNGSGAGLSNVNAAMLGGQAPNAFALVGASNTFTAKQDIQADLGLTIANGMNPTLSVNGTDANMSLKNGTLTAATGPSASIPSTLTIQPFSIDVHTPGAGDAGLVAGTLNVSVSLASGLFGGEVTASGSGVDLAAFAATGSQTTGNSAAVRGGPGNAANGGAGGDVNITGGDGVGSNPGGNVNLDGGAGNPPGKVILSSPLMFPDGTTQTTAFLGGGGAGGGTITGVTAGTGLIGGGTSGNVSLAINAAVVATLGTANTFTGPITAPLFNGSGAGLTNVNAFALNGLPSSAFAQTGASNTFNGNQDIQGNLSLTNSNGQPTFSINGTSGTITLSNGKSTVMQSGAGPAQSSTCTGAGCTAAANHQMCVGPSCGNSVGTESMCTGDGCEASHSECTGMGCTASDNRNMCVGLACGNTFGTNSMCTGDGCEATRSVSSGNGSKALDVQNTCTGTGCGTTTGAMMMCTDPMSTACTPLVAGNAGTGDVFVGQHGAVKVFMVDTMGNATAMNSVGAPTVCVGTDCRTAWPSGGGALTGVTAGTGLIGGGTSGVVSVALDSNSANQWNAIQTYIASIRANSGLTAGAIKLDATSGSITTNGLTSTGNIGGPSASIATLASTAITSATVDASQSIHAGSAHMDCTLTLVNCIDIGGSVTPTVTVTDVAGNQSTISGASPLVIDSLKGEVIIGANTSGTGTTGNINLNPGSAGKVNINGGILSAKAGVDLPALSTANSISGSKSSLLTATASSFSTIDNAAHSFAYAWQVVPTGNNSTAPSATSDLVLVVDNSPPQFTGARFDSGGDLTIRSLKDLGTGTTISLPTNCLAGQTTVFMATAWGCGTVGGGGTVSLTGINGVKVSPNPCTTGTCTAGLDPAVATVSGNSVTFTGDVSTSSATLTGGQVVATTSLNAPFASFTNPGILNATSATIGTLNVTASLTKPAGSFKIDHPLDPERKNLYHSFVESPDMKNIYDGVAKLDEKGEAWVNLPNWFEALNSDFRYQLTAIGGPAPNLYIAQEISGNRFQIAGGKPGGKVSWQVTGTRQDAYAQKHRIQVEEEKPAAEQGFYLYPEAYGQPEEKSVSWARAHPPAPKPNDSPKGQ